MASTISSPLHYLFLILVLLLLQFTHSAIVPNPNPKNHIEHKPQLSSTYIVHTNHLSKPSRFATLESWYASVVPAHSPRATNSKRIRHTYDTVTHGFAVRLTDDEARRMSSIPGVYKDTRHRTQTTRSPAFIGLDPVLGAWPDSDFGDGVVIGIVDAGIWPEHASFDDSGLGPVRPSWRGKCVDAEGFNASLCNNKLVGARAFAAEPDGTFSLRDKDGHGTHVAAMAVGSKVGGASLFDFSRGNASGVAPKANIAMYKACDQYGCDGSDIAAAIDAAVKDGVDVLSISLGGPVYPFYHDVLAVATFGAEREGVFVILSAGNAGPEASTVNNVAPWMTTVGAGTMDQLFPAKLTLGNGVVFTGPSLYGTKAQGTGFIRLVNSSCVPEELTPDRVMGTLVVCIGADVDTGIQVQAAGGAGLITADSRQWLSDGVTAHAFTLLALSLGYTGAEKLMAYMVSASYPVLASRPH